LFEIRNGLICWSAVHGLDFRPAASSFLGTMSEPNVWFPESRGQGNDNTLLRENTSLSVTNSIRRSSQSNLARSDGDRLGLPSPDDVQHAFDDYVADYQKRLAHDQQFPDEPKQIRPGERVGSPDGSSGWTVRRRICSLPTA
jgi:hypothetical protein